MFPLNFFGLVFGFILVAAAIIGWVIVTVVRTVKGSGANKSPEHEEETRVIQELYQGLHRMEQRIEALETLLLEKDGKG